MKKYYYLVKPGIIYGNAFTAVAGFLLAAQRRPQIGLLLAMLAGLSCIIAAACVCNNYIDRSVDKHMQRTRTRALVIGSITPIRALSVAFGLGLGGTILLACYTPPLTLLIALFGAVVYLVPYGVTKRRSPYGTLVGSLAGAVPPVVGYAAVTGRLDFAAVLLGATLALWQMPHFYAIALYRQRDYAAAGIPVLPVVLGTYVTKLHILVYISCFAVCTLLFTVYGYTGVIYLSVMVLATSWWLGRGIYLWRRLKPAAWGRTMFLSSLIVLCSWSVLLMAAAWLP